MKKSILLIILTLLILTSCTSDNTNLEGELPEQKAENSLKKTDSLSLDYFSVLSLDDQRKEFVNLNSDQKKSLWIAKFELLIQSTKAKDEIKFYKDILENIKEINFSKNISTKNFHYKWKPLINTLQIDFDWSDEDVAAMFSTLYPVLQAGTNNKNKVINHLEINLQYSPNTQFATTCNCRWGGLGCAGNNCVEKDNCPERIEDDIGCGFIFLQTCTGQCA